MKINKVVVDEFYEQSLATLMSLNEYIVKLIDKVTQFNTKELTLGASAFLKFTSTLKKKTDFFTKFDPYIKEQAAP